MKHPLPTSPAPALAGNPSGPPRELRLCEQAVFVSSPVDMAIARQAARAIANHLALPENAAAGFITSVSELASNILIHARRGEILVQAIQCTHTRRAARVIARDRGPGIADIPLAFLDGYSTVRGLGGGLPGVKRLMDEVEVTSTPGVGTVVVANKYLQSRRPTVTSLNVGIAHAPAAGSFVSGDAPYFDESGGTSLLAVIDGVGHGRRAALASATAIRVLGERDSNEPQAILRGLHQALRSSVGAAIGMYLVSPGSHTLTFVGVGNVRGLSDGQRRRHFESAPGVLGEFMGDIRSVTVEYHPGDLLLLWSDGVAVRSPTDGIPPLIRLQPDLAAREILERFRLPSDDGTVLVAR